MSFVPKKARHDIARALIHLGDLGSAERIVEAELEQRKDQGSASEIWSLRFLRADVIRLRGQTEQAIGYLASKEADFAPSGDDIASIVGLKKHRGYYLGLLAQYESSHLLLNEAESMARDAAMLELQCEIWQCQAMIFHLQEDYASSDRAYNLILGAAELVGGWYFQAGASWGIGRNLAIQGHHEAAIPWLEDSLALFESAGAGLPVANVSSELAVCHLGLGHDQNALELLQRALRVNQEAETVQNCQVILGNIGNIYLHRADSLTAIAYYRRALALAREIKDPVSIKKWSHNIRLAYARLRQAVDNLDSKTA